MLHGSMTTIITINSVVVLFVFLIASNFIFYRKYKSALGSTSNDDSEKSPDPTDDTEHPINNGGIPEDNTSCLNQQEEIDRLTQSIETREKRIENLEKFKQLYFKLDEKVSSETKTVHKAFVTLSHFAQKKSSSNELMEQAEVSYQSLKSINPFLKALREEAFKISDDTPVAKKEKSELIEKQRSIIKNLRVELSHSKSSLEKLKVLEQSTIQLTKLSKT